MEGLIEGRIVHYVAQHPDQPHWAAIVNGVHDGLVNLHVFPDTDAMEPQFEVGGVAYSENHEAHTWHWIERA